MRSDRRAVALAVLLPVLLLPVLLLAACTGRVLPAGPAAGGPPTTVTLRSCAAPETLRTPARRVAVTEPGVTDTVYALGVGDRLVARSGSQVSGGDPHYRARLATVPDIGPSVPSTEGLLAARPDLVVVARAYHLDPSAGGADGPALRAAGVGVHHLRSACAGGLDAGRGDDVDGVLADIIDVGTLLGVPDRARILTARLRAERDDLRRRVAAEPPVRGVGLSIVGGQLYATTGGLGQAMLSEAGVENPFADPTRQFVAVGPEVVSARNPQAIVVSSFAASGPVEAQLDQLRRTFPTTDAVRRGRLLVQDAARASPASPAVFDGIAELARFAHPRVVSPR